jgi:NodT family efflux transporter outer membrane factor (OMF) lipoprotein
MSRTPVTATLLPALLLAGCNLAPTYRPPAIATIPSSFKEAPGWRAAAPSDAIVRGEWWALFNDPTLDALERKVIVSNQNLAAAKAAYDQARALVREQRAALFPTIDASAGATKAGSFGAGKPTVGTGTSATTSASSQRFSLSVGATWEPDLWGQIGNAVKQAGALAQASRSDLINATLSAQGELALDYVQLRGLDMQKDILTATVTAYDRSLTITNNRYNAGVVARADVLQAETALRNARADLADLERQRATLEHAIAVLVGENPSGFTLPATSWQRTVPDVPAILPTELLERRPDVAAAERRVAAANAAIGIQRAAFFPTIGLSGDVGSSTSSLGKLFSVASSVWSLGLTGALTLLDFGARSAKVAEARAAYEQTVAEYRQTALTAFQQTEDQLVAVRVYGTVAQERAAAAVAANRAEAIARNQYVAGQIGYADVIVAQTTALSARTADVQAVVNRQSAVISLIQAIGGRWGEAAGSAAPLH